MSRILRVKIKVFQLLAGAAAGSAVVWSAAVFAQSAPVISQPVVQPLPNENTARLNAALTKLGREPRNVEALADAGDAARGLGDFDAAIGFYRRADEIAPNDARVKAGLARAYVMKGDPVTALAYFAAAEKAGATPAQIDADRGLAYDLVGDNATAQRYYAQAMAADGTDEVRMRLALSQAISGNQKAAETTLMPLLRKQDKPGWRARAFALAIDGEIKQAVDITETILPPKLAESVAPYMRYMPRLTRAQQAAAANLGRFPRASEIGRDDPRIAAYAPPRVAVADAGAVPGEPAGKSAKAAKAAASRSRAAKAEAGKASRKSSQTALAAADPDRVAPPDPKPAIDSTGELPPLRRTDDTLPAGPRPVPAAAAKTASAMPVRPALPAPAAAPSAPEPSLAEAFADIGKPVIRAVPASGAVDVRKIDPARPEPKAEEKPRPKKPAPPAHPSRIWVQIGVGRNKSAIAFDWRRYTRQVPALFKGRPAYISEMGRTNRILAGPFATEKAANAFIADLKKAGIDGALPWTSPAGQVVDELSVK